MKTQRVSHGTLAMLVGVIVSGFLAAVPLRAADVTATWNGTTGNWTDPTKWSSNPLYPNNGNGGNTYDAVVNAGTVTLDLAAGIALQNLTLGGGTINGDYNLTVNNLMNWTTATFAGSGTTTLATGSTLNLSGAGGFAYLTGRTLGNAGTLNYTKTDYSLRLSNATISNTGTFNADITSIYNGSIESYSGTNVFNNSGTFNKTGADRFTVSVPMNNSGTVNTQVGILQLSGGGTHTGTFNVSSGATLSFAGGTHTFNTGASLSGAGALVFGGGYDGTSNLAGTMLNTTGPVTLSSGILNITGDNSFSNFTWSGGTLRGSGTTTLSAGGTFAVTSGVGLSGGRTLLNAGTINDSHGSTWTLNDGTINNTGTFNSVSTASQYIYFSGGTNAFNNAGTFNKANSNTCYIGIPFNNSGAVNVQGGLLLLYGGGTHSGTYNVNSGAILQFERTHTFNAGANFSGAGALVFGGTYDGTFGLASSMLNTTGPVTLSGGSTLNITGDNAFNNNFSWTGGTLGGAGKTTVSPDATTNITTGAYSGVSLKDRTLQNHGTLNLAMWGQSSVGLDNATLNNAGTFNATLPGGDVSISGTGQFNNTGTLIKGSGGPLNMLTIFVPFTNSGVANVQLGTLTLSGGGTHTGVFNISPGAKLDFAGGTHDLNTGSSIAGAGTLSVSGGTVNVPSSLLNTAGPISLSGGTLSITGDNTATRFDWTGSYIAPTLTGSGTTTVPAGGTMNVTGGIGSYRVSLKDRTLQNNGTINLGMWGQSGVGLDNATLNNAGTFNATLPGGDVSISGTGQFNNTGTLIKGSGGPLNMLTIFVPFTNSGVANVQLGTLTLSGGGTHIGTFNVSSGAKLDFAGGTHDLSTESNIAGAGTLSVSAGTVNVPSSGLNITGPITHSGGTLKITGDHATTRFDWIGSSAAPTLTGSGATTVAAGGTMNISGAGYSGVLLKDRTLQNNGTINLGMWGQSGVGLDNATLNNAGTFNATLPGGDVSISGTGQFNNTGTLIKGSGGPLNMLTISVPLANHGSVAVQAGSLVIGKTTTYDGYSGNGKVDVGANTLTFQSAGFTPLGQLTSLAGGTVNAARGLALGTGSNLVGSGTVNAKIAAGFGSTIQATGGNLTLGDAAALDGFYSDGVLRTDANTVTVKDRNVAVLGALTQLGTSSATGTLVAGNANPADAFAHFLLEQGKALAGRGNVQGHFKNHGDVVGDGSATLAQRIVFDAPWTVSGKGSFANTLVMGTFAPGDSPAISSVTNQAYGGTVEIELGGTTPGSANNNHDQINDSATMTLVGAPTLKILPWNSFVPQVGDAFVILTWQAGLDGAFGATSIDPWFASHGIAFEQRYTNTGGAGNLTLIAAPVPEPGCATLLAAGLLLGLGARRRGRA